MQENLPNKNITLLPFFFSTESWLFVRSLIFSWITNTLSGGLRHHSDCFTITLQLQIWEDTFLHAICMAEFLKITLNNFRIKRGKRLWRQKTSYFRLCFNLTRGNFLAGLRFVHLNFSPDLVASFELETIDLRFYRVWKFQSAFHSSIILWLLRYLYYFVNTKITRSDDFVVRVVILQPAISLEVTW